MQITIGLLNTYQLYALFGFSFRLTHYALSWIVIGSLVIHIGVKLPDHRAVLAQDATPTSGWIARPMSRMIRMPSWRFPMSCSG